VNVGTRQEVVIYFLGEFKTTGAVKVMSDEKLTLLRMVARVGGLADTVIDHRPPVVGTGFTFDSYDGMALFGTVVRAVEVYGYPELWAAIQRHAMQQDFSWTQPAHAYHDLYRRARSLKLTGMPA